MKTVAPDGEQGEVLLAGQKVAISAENATAIVLVSSLPQTPERFVQVARFTDSAQEVGPFLIDKRIRIQATQNLVRYKIDVDPKIVCRKDDKIGVGILDPVAQVDVDGDIAATGSGGGGATLPIDVSDSPGSVVNVLGTANGGSGGLNNGRIPYVASGVFTSSPGLVFSAISGDLGVGGTPSRRIEAVTQATNDGIRIRTTGATHNALMEIDAGASALFHADRGHQVYESSVRHLTNNVLKWTAGLITSSTGFSIKSATRGIPDVFVSDVTGRVGIGTALPMAELHVIKDSVIVRIDNTENAGQALLSVKSDTPGGGSAIDSERSTEFTDGYFAAKTVFSGTDWYFGAFASPAGLTNSLSFKKTSLTADPALAIDDGLLVGVNANGGDLGEGTVNTEKGVFTNGANGSHRGTRVVTPDANTSVLISDSVVVIDVTNFTANRTVIIDTDVFQDAFGTTGGREITLINTGTSAFTLTLDFEGTQTIYGTGGFVIPADTSDTILCTNTGGVSGEGAAYLLSRYTN